MEEKSVEAINKAKNDVKANKEKINNNINNNINSKNAESNPEAKENIEVASSPEVTETKKKSIKES